MKTVTALLFAACCAPIATAQMIEHPETTWNRSDGTSFPAKYAGHTEDGQVHLERAGEPRLEVLDRSELASDSQTVADYCRELELIAKRRQQRPDSVAPVVQPQAKEKWWRVFR